ncbi:MAG: hypothetical protein E6248_11790 [Clostridium sp.]|uniref:hypothetical protein n=1 Tax=Clostridium sp. TaxID=1506 RepID=UPI002910418C|nr:hypothetical protein [Clostridium sp.]MDU5111123.1 hypothetical protein [Clostridium sp.]
MGKRKIGLILITILICIVGVFTVIKSITSSEENIEEIKVAIESSEEEAAAYLSKSMDFNPKIEDTGKQNLKYKWELINAREERIADSNGQYKKIINDGERVTFSPDLLGGFNKEAPITKTITVRLTILEDGKKIGSAVLLLDDHDGYYIIRR